MKKAMRDMGVPSVGCVAHSCQLCVHEGLLSQRSVTEILANARKIVGHFKHSPLAYFRLEDIQMDLNMDIKRLLYKMYSRLYMLQSLLQQKRAPSVFAAERTLPATLTAHQWELMNKTADVLSPFEELTRDVSRETATAADVNEHLIQEVAKAEGRKAVSAMPEENEAAAEPMSKAPHHEACSSLDIAFEEILQERQSQGRSVSTTSAETHVQTYLSEKNTPKKSDPLQYWKEHANQFPSMAAVATQYFSAPCSSVDSERLFSAVANVLDENRNRLKPDKKYQMGTQYRQILKIK
ncbi:zinc finger BED domain-containing protein 4-like isoform X1 [Tachysurus ichikawai]